MAIVALGVLGEPPAAPPPGLDAPADAAALEAAQADSGVPLERRSFALSNRRLPIRDVVALHSPGPGPITVTTARLTVIGRVLVRADRIRIALEARGNRTLESHFLDIADLDGGIRPEHHPAFRTTFELPALRPNGTMWVVVTAYDADGMPLGGTRRPVRIGAVLTALDPRPLDGWRLD